MFNATHHERAADFTVERAQLDNQDGQVSDFVGGSFTNTADDSPVSPYSGSLLSHLSAIDTDALLDERRALVDRKINGEASPAEERRLAFIRWQLDRLEEAALSGHLAALSRMSAERRDLARQVQQFVASVQQVLTNRR